MFYPIKDGSSEVVYNYTCYLPPVGYGKNCITGELEFLGVLSNSAKPKDQKWQRIPLPLDYAKKTLKESKKQEEDPDYIDHALETFRQQQWRYRLCGAWFMNKGKPVYITGNHFFYLNWVLIDIGAPDFRDSDRKFFYTWRYCEEDPNCGGMIHAARRREGKTFKGGSIILEYISRTSNVNAGIQSKTASDAKEVFKKAVVNVFKKLPDFFRPVFDNSKGLTPTSELRFSKTTIKGKAALSNIDKPELDSYIDWKSSDMFAYDGTKQTRHFEDEVGKSVEINVYERWQVNRFCLDQDGKWVGCALLSTTVEDLENGGEAFKQLWQASNPAEKDKNGRTKSGLYRLFMPAFETTLFDDYGMPRTDEAKEYYLNQRDGLKSDPKALSSIIRKNPFTEEEMFRIDGDKCLYNAMKLNDRLDYLSWNNDITEQGNFQWEGGVRFSRVEWVKSRNGRWEIPRGFSFASKEDTNNVVKRGNLVFPGNKMRFVSAVDPYDHNITEDNNRASKAACLTLKKHDPMGGEDPFNKAFVCKYFARPNMASMMYEDVLMQCIYFGSALLVESQKPGIMKFFRDMGYGEFLIHLPGYAEPGIPSTGDNKQTLSFLTEEYIETNIEKVFFKDLITQWLEFDLLKTQKHDLVMGAGWALVADMHVLARKEVSELRDVKDYFRTYNVA